MKNEKRQEKVSPQRDMMVGETGFRHSSHSHYRASQRGVKNPWIRILLIDGRVIHKQGMKFYFMTDKELRYFEPEMQKRLKNLVVVVAMDENRVITCYKSQDAIKNIKRKSKRLIR